MKNNSIFKKLFAVTAILGIAFSMSSCKKNDVDESGSANIRVINASASSSAQSFYLANSAVVQGGLRYGDNTNYMAVNSGNNLVTEFRNEGSSAVYASGRFDITNALSYSIFLAGDGQQARVKVYDDNNAAPASGKARLRFIHLSDGAPEFIDVRTSLNATTSVVAGLKRDNASTYVDVDAGLSSLFVFQGGQSASLGNFNFSAFTAGKIYTVYITGSTSSTIRVNQFTQN